MVSWLVGWLGGGGGVKIKGKSMVGGGVWVDNGAWDYIINRLSINSAFKDKYHSNKELLVHNIFNNSTCIQTLVQGEPHHIALQIDIIKQHVLKRVRLKFYVGRPIIKFS